jgi:hypothetical protein
MYLLALAIVLVAIGTERYPILPLLAPVLLCLLPGPARPGVLQSRLVFGIVLLGLVAALILTLLALPGWLGGLLLASAGVIVWVNRPLYAFFRRTRGITFAAAVIPFQLLYYFYSVLSLVVATGLYTVSRTGRPWLPAALRARLAGQLAQ